MASLKEIRTRIHSVQNIQKITRTMEMVAASQLRKAQIKAEQARPYAAKIKELLDDLPSSELTHPLLKQRDVNNIALIVVGSDRGLCGSYNTNIFTKVDRFLNNHQPDQIRLFTIGRKVSDHYRSSKWNIHLDVSGLDKITYHEIVRLSDRLMDDFIDGSYDEVWLIYTEYVNVMTRRVMTEKLLPLENTLLHSRSEKTEPIIEPSPTELLAALLPRYCITKLQATFNEAYASELAARILSMKSATKNADEMIENLTLERNKIRQSAITREIAEISNGAASIT